MNSRPKRVVNSEDPVKELLGAEDGESISGALKRLGREYEVEYFVD